MSLTKKPELNLPKRLLKKCSRFQKPDFAKQNASHEERTLPNETACLLKPKPKTLKPILET
ncbi:MAG: hypothetical protein LC111_09540 [Bacteroidia bacterium]|nr:hypothetical protein [Bacteroidia bacterium]MCZ2248987.1 hypothetical protein [Bacteroidia bacterium]